MITRKHLQKYIATNEKLTIGKIGDVKSNELIDFWFHAYAFCSQEAFKELPEEEKQVFEGIDKEMSVKPYNSSEDDPCPLFYMSIRMIGDTCYTDSEFFESDLSEKIDMINEAQQHIFLHVQDIGIEKHKLKDNPFGFNEDLEEI